MNQMPHTATAGADDHEPGVRRDDFSGRELATTGETQAGALAAQATAIINARYIMAMKRPRDLDNARVALMKECKRPGFALVARYLKPIGKGISGPSIRFAEAAIRCMTNIAIDTATIFESPAKRVIRVTVADLESNVPYSRDVTVDKTVERKQLRDGQIPISVRTNSEGVRTFLVQASEDDLLNKEGALLSKAIRTLALRLVPGDLIDEGMATCVATIQSRVKEDPDAARKALADAFSGIGVLPPHLKAYLGHPLEQCSPAQIVDLRGIYAAIKDGQTTWQEVTEEKRAEDAETGKPAAASTESGTAGVKETLKKMKEAKAAGGVQPGTKATSDANVAPTSASAPSDPPAAAPKDTKRAPLSDATRKVLEERLQKLYGTMSPESMPSAIDVALGNCGIDDWSQVNESIATDAINAIDAELKAQKKGTK